MHVLILLPQSSRAPTSSRLTTHLLGVHHSQLDLEKLTAATNNKRFEEGGYISVFATRMYNSFRCKIYCSILVNGAQIGRHIVVALDMVVSIGVLLWAAEKIRCKQAIRALRRSSPVLSSLEPVAGPCCCVCVSRPTLTSPISSTGLVSHPRLVSEGLARSPSATS